MARQERPVDPTAGPLQALAYDLRRLRAEAGGPTYRVLAKAAGYSATTLSEAAGGIRLPTLEVLLAYVGACRGDLEDWRRRWYETAAEVRPAGDARADRTRAGDAPGPAPVPVGPALVGPVSVGPWSGGPVPGAAPPPVSFPGPGAGSGPRRRRVAVVSVVAATLLIGVVVLTGLSLAGPLLGIGPGENGTVPGPPSGATPCPGVPSDAVFTGVTYGAGAHVRDGAGRDETLLSTIPPHCTIGFTGFCIGEKVYDNTGGTPDVRWFKVAGGGVTSSAVIHGNPPRALRASGCPNGRSAPTALDFSIVADEARPGAVTLHASGKDLDIVGFSTSSATDVAAPDSRRWRQVSLTDVRDPAVGARAQLGAVAAPRTRGTVILVAAACLGGDSPTGLVAARQVHLRSPGRSMPAALDPAQRTAAATSACRYPDRG